MLAEEKKIIWDLLKVSSNYLLGYKSSLFKQEVIFTDDKKTYKNKNDDLQNDTNKEAIINENTNTDKLQLVSSSSKITEISRIAEKIKVCENCSLSKTRKNVVPGTGVLSPLVLVVGEAPGADEDDKGLPFVGAAGQLLDKMLSSINLSRDKNCYIANIVKCRPPNNRTPLPEESNSCIYFLKEQIKILNPKMILAVGKIAGQNLLQVENSLSSMRGVFYSYENIPLLVTYHPSALLRDASLKRHAWEDLKKFRDELKKIDKEYESTL